MMSLNLSHCESVTDGARCLNAHEKEVEMLTDDYASELSFVDDCLTMDLKREAIIPGGDSLVTEPTIMVGTFTTKITLEAWFKYEDYVLRATKQKTWLTGQEGYGYATRLLQDHVNNGINFIPGYKARRLSALAGFAMESSYTSVTVAEVAGEITKQDIEGIRQEPNYRSERIGNYSIIFADKLSNSQPNALNPIVLNQSAAQLAKTRIERKKATREVDEYFDDNPEIPRTIETEAAMKTLTRMRLAKENNHIPDKSQVAKSREYLLHSEIIDLSLAVDGLNFAAKIIAQGKQLWPSSVPAQALASTQ